jgi:hypothetical protein
MNKILRHASLMAATAAAGAALALPASAAHADEPLPCPRIFGVVCTFTGPHGEGDLRLLSGPRPVLVPPVRSAQNQDDRPWCFYNRPGFQGERRELAQGQSIGDLVAFSAKPGYCE